MDFIVVSAVAIIAIWIARLYYEPHKHPDFSPLSPEKIKQRKAIYELVRWLAFIAALSALLRTCYVFTS
jgi:hypothetical protein